MKKILILSLVVVIIAVLGITAFAANETDSKKDTGKVASEYCSENCEDGCNCSETGVCTCDESVCGNEAGKCGAGLCGDTAKGNCGKARL